MAGRLRAFSIAMSVDGFIAGPNQTIEEPLGLGGERLHDWAVATRAFHDQHGMEGGPNDGGNSIDDRFIRRRVDGIGATIMGRNMFGPVRGEWPDESWRGWWGDDPPYHHPVFVLTHHARPPLQMGGGTTFHFVTDGIEAALQQAQAAAGDLDIALGGGASTIRQYLRAGLLDELHVAIAPILLGGGERVFDPADGPLGLEVREHVSSEAVMHVVFARAGR
jgi:dihydrofolate reductase